MKEKLKQQDEFRWWLDKSARERMKVSAKIIGSRKIIDALEDAAVEQLTNVATLPGAVEPVLAMPDAHWGYGLPMGAVGAFDAEEGIISAGCTGFDINCGVRLLRTNLTLDALKPKLRQLMDELFRRVPAGVGSKGKLRLSDGQFNDVVRLGARWAIENDHGIEADLTHCEETGGMEGAATKAPRITEKARRRGRPQLGTLGAGNHYLEVQKVEKIFDENAAKTFGLESGQIVVMLHCGSRGFGHQVATDYLERMATAVKKYNIWLPDKQLVCAPASSPEGQDYYAAMKAAVNFAFCNRQVMTHWIREGFEAVFSKDWEKIGLNLVYDVTHNICKFETHETNGTKRDLYVHRKGATRAFGPGNPLIPEAYRSVGQPVLIGGSMGTASYVLVGTEQAMKETFGSTCHGAGRAMSRKAAIRRYHGRDIKQALEQKGEVIRSTGTKILAEEAPKAYKDVHIVVDSVHGADISRKVACQVPLGVVKG
ncbi:MAG: RtcB family protein [Candidatus Hermodarchaeota archaeon]|nr:RtcB family protein [Candidatus Hermodarchaeota archaeon]